MLERFHLGTHVVLTGPSSEKIDFLADCASAVTDSAVTVPITRSPARHAVRIVEFITASVRDAGRAACSIGA
jgi:hypothetical protein